MKTKLLLTFIFFSISFTSLYSQLTSERPDQTESSLVLSKGHVQIETGISIEDSESNINTLFRIGIIDGIEMRLNSNYLINDDISNLKKSSFSDFEIGAKFKILDEDNNRIKIGFLTHLSVPTAPEIFSYNEYGLLSRLLVSHDIKNDSQIGYNIGYNKYNNYDGQFIYTLVYGKSLGSFGVFFEIFGEESSNNSNLNFDSGITYLVDNDKQLDLSIGRGLNSDMFYISAGFSIDIY
ncbi:MAG: transporter [Flavobacteriaceae bacterium]|nr:transporter [Flavobacteriaceae bacterium]